MTTDWRLDAACWSMAHEQGSFDIFFEEDRAQEAKRICQDCNVRFECLDSAISEHEYYGIRGGMTPKERVSLARRWRYWSARAERRVDLVEWAKEMVG